MKVVCFSNSLEQSNAALEAGGDLIFTSNLEDMTDPTRTIYIITGAGYVDNVKVAKQYGYLNIGRKPLSLYVDGREVYPIAINSDMYRQNLQLRLNYLKEFTNLPYGIHIGGSHNLIEHCIPEGKGVSNEYWCHGFTETHHHDSSDTFSQFQVDVWEEETMNWIDQVESAFPKVEIITTAYRCPSKAETRKTTCMMTSGEELWGLMKHLSIYDKWRNIFFSFFHSEPNRKVDVNKIIRLRQDLDRHRLTSRAFVGAEGASGLLGKNTKAYPLCPEVVGLGTGFMAYMSGCHSGMIGRFDKFTPDLIKRIKLVQQYP